MAAAWPAGKLSVEAYVMSYTLLVSLKWLCKSIYRWIDAGKFLTGFSAVGSVAIPAILFHSEARISIFIRSCICVTVVLQTAKRSYFVDTIKLSTAMQKITAGALGMELVAVAVLGGTVLAYDYFTSRDSVYYY